MKFLKLEETKKNLPLEGLCDKDPPAPAEEHIYKLK